MARRIEALTLIGPAGRLEAMLEAPEEGEPRECALVCHPHPLYGGTMHNKVVHRLARGLRRNGAAVMRFNFRGVGMSEGTHDHGRGELDDARACLDWLRDRYPDLPYTVGGFSFGSRIALRLGCSLGTAARMIAAGFPTRGGAEISGLSACRRPKVFIQSTNDAHGPEAELKTLFETFASPKRLIWIPARDHFFEGALGDFEQAVFGLGSAADPREGD